MPRPEPQPGLDGPPSDFINVLRSAGILSEPVVDEIRAKVLAGKYPFNSIQLSEQLVKEHLLTEYQAARLLKNKPHGMAFGKYVILDKIGSGAMGRVYKARHLLMGRHVALKIIAPEVLTNRRGVGRFRREMQLVGRLDHPNVVRAFDADQVGPQLYIVMEYVPGQSLGQLMRRVGPLPARDVARYAAQASRGLGHAHEQGIVHRDVKPTTILLGDDGRVRVLDLGLGVLLEPEPNCGFMTADGIAVGTIDYMSPEQACGRDVDGRSDLYSLGCAMFHLITGQFAFPGATKVDRMVRRLETPPESLETYVKDLPSGLTEVMSRLLAREPANRYQTAEDAAQALEDVAEGRVGKASANILAPSTRPLRPAQPLEPRSETDPGFIPDSGPPHINADSVDDLRLLPSPSPPGLIASIADLAIEKPRRLAIYLAVTISGAFLAGLLLGRLWPR